MSSQWLFVPVNVVLKRYLIACQTFEQMSDIQQRQLCLSNRKYTYKNKNDADNHLHNCVSAVRSIKTEIVKNILAKFHSG